MQFTDPTTEAVAQITKSSVRNAIQNSHPLADWEEYNRAIDAASEVTA